MVCDVSKMVNNISSVVVWLMLMGKDVLS